MTPPPQTTLTLVNADRTTGTAHATTLAAMVQGPIRRSIGAGPDRITLTVNKAAWPVDGGGGGAWDMGGEFRLVINGGQGAGAELTLAGYRLVSRMPTGMGIEQDDPGGDAENKLYRVVLETDVSGLRQGLGNLIMEGTLNELGEDGLVDTAHADYKTIQQLVDIALDATGLPHQAAPIGLNTGIDGSTLDAPGPMDWGNARPIDELEQILGRIGWTLVQRNDGELRVVRLLRAGEGITMPDEVVDNAEPYELGSTPSVHKSKIIITSGPTRSTIITSRTLAPAEPDEDVDYLQWTVFDPATNEWTDQPGTALADYKAGLTPADVTPGGNRALGQLYRAVRLSGDDLTQASMFVNIPQSVDAGALADFAGAAGVVEARVAVKLAGEQLQNVPEADDGTPVRIDGLRAIPGAGVFVLPTDAEFVRPASLATGRRGDVRELEGDDLTITFAHEANTGTYQYDYFVAGYQWSLVGGVLTVEAMPFSETEPLLDDPTVPKVGLPILRKIMTMDQSDPPELVSLNGEALEEIARQAAMAYVSDDNAQAAAIELRGIIDLNPGDIGGGLTSISWDVFSRTTVITVNQHELPGSFYERLQRSAGRSVAAGIGTLRLNRSSAAGGDLRAIMAASAQDAVSSGGGGGGGSGGATPEANAVVRGRTRALSGVRGSVESGPLGRSELATIAEQSGFWARITGSTADGSNKWLYDWEEVRFESDEAVTTGSVRKSSTHGQALNSIELNNTGTGMQGNGTDVDGGDMLLPIPDGVATVWMHGPIGGRYIFSAWNSVECAS